MTAWLTLGLIGLSARCVVSCDDPASMPASAPDQVARLLHDGRLDDAVRAAQQAYTARPDDPAAREQFIRLHLSLARRMIGERQFEAALRVLAAVTAVESGQPEARRMLDAIRTARDTAPAKVDVARTSLKFEWFESAYETLDEAVALLPDRRSEWARDLLAAAEGAGDDHFFCKNFHQAFFYHDAVVKSGRAESESLGRRWLLSLVFSLADDIERVRYPIEFWHQTVTGAESRAARRSDPLLCLLRGLANENLNDPDRAAANYAEVSGQTTTGRSPAAIRAARAAALVVARRQYDEKLSGRRGGVWERYEPGEWRVLERPRFRIHHRNAEAAARVAGALEFHFDRLAAFLGRTPQQISWPVSCDVFLYRDAAELRAAATRGGVIRGSSAITLADGALRAHAIHIAQDDPLLLASTLPHELMHLVFGAATSYRPVPAAINEGLSLRVEPRCRAVQFARVLADEGGARPLEAVLRQSDIHPSEDRRFYGEAGRLIAILLERGPATNLLDLRGNGDMAAQLATVYGFTRPQELDAALRGPPVPATQPAKQTP